MANLKRTVLGIEIGEQEVRMVEMRGSGNQPHILKAGAARLPAGTMDGPRIVQVEPVAELIRGLYTRLGCQARAAIVGMGVQSIVTRILAIPRVPESELRAVLEGELAHYQILRAGTGAFDYFPLEPPNATADSMPSVLLMAVEDRIAQGYRLVIEKAGLQMLALEPITLSLFRAAYPLTQAEPAALCLAITPQRSELSILDHGQIRLYRRLEMGSDDFIQGRRNMDGPVRGPVNLMGDTAEMADTAGLEFRGGSLLNMNEDEDTAELDNFVGGRPAGTGPLPPLESEKPGRIIPQAAAAFANEIQRSLDYYRREYPNATAIGRILLPTNDPDAAALSDWLAPALRMDVRIAEPPSDPTLPRQVAAQLEAPQGLRFLGASGLALQAVTQDWKQVPRFNLLTGGPSLVAPMERDRLTVVMLMAVGILFTGFLVGNLFYRNAELQTSLLNQKRQTLAVHQRDYFNLQDTIQKEFVVDAIVKSDNLPMPSLVDLLTQQLPPEVGLTAIDIQRNGKIIVEGNAQEMAYFTLYYSNLQGCPYFLAPRWKYLNSDQKSHIVTFRVETSLKGTQAALSDRETPPGR